MRSRNDWNDLPDNWMIRTMPMWRTGTSFPDPWDGDHDIEYWVWGGDRLVPATPSAAGAIQETERTRRRVAAWRDGTMTTSMGSSSACPCALRRRQGNAPAHRNRPAYVAS